MSAASKTFVIGRGRDSDILLTHSSVSRRHAELAMSPDGTTEIRDLGSTGGTFLLRGSKETQVDARVVLKTSDTVRLGDYEISAKDLLSLVPEEKSEVRSKRVQSGGSSGTRSGQQPQPVPVAEKSAPAAPSPAGAKNRMMRCSCGSIKERGKPCPDCGS